jgi:hypothetical protein
MYLLCNRIKAGAASTHALCILGRFAADGAGSRDAALLILGAKITCGVARHILISP